MLIMESKDYRFGKLNICEDGIIELKSDFESFELQDYKDLFIAIKDISGGKLMPYMTDERGKQRYMDNKSKKFLNDNLHLHVSACAIIENSAVLRFLTHTYVSIYKPKAPMRMFKTKKEAKEWLRTFND